jgi:hypothetical protein
MNAHFAEPQGGAAARRRLDGVVGAFQHKEEAGGRDFLLHASLGLVLLGLGIAAWFFVRRALRRAALRRAADVTERKSDGGSTLRRDEPSSEIALVSTSEADQIDRRIEEWAAAEAARAADGAAACLLERVRVGSSAVLAWKPPGAVETVRAPALVVGVDRRGAVLESEIALPPETVGKDAVLVVFDGRGGASVFGVAAAAERIPGAGRLRVASSTPGVLLRPGARRPCEIRAEAVLPDGSETPLRFVGLGLEGATGIGPPPAAAGAEIEFWSSFDDGGEAQPVVCTVDEAPDAADGEARFSATFRRPTPDLQSRIAARLYRAAHERALRS